MLALIIASYTVSLVSLHVLVKPNQVHQEVAIRFASVLMLHLSLKAN